eukprot:TRINITY_DN108417_c0_g1_i1.p2 TRINITY_DN108417_c0_g1~~TRINITY_DN108417_c0_g1_i1.p2  ORF type:complete len:100 (-),score=1.30 TRINITY_DN108417_c0_g1_i1:313-612(-)
MGQHSPAALPWGSSTAHFPAISSGAPGKSTGVLSDSLTSVIFGCMPLQLYVSRAECIAMSTCLYVIQSRPCAVKKPEMNGFDEAVERGISLGTQVVSVV